MDKTSNNRKRIMEKCRQGQKVEEKNIELMYWGVWIFFNYYVFVAG